MSNAPDYSVRTAAVELGCSEQLIRYYCRRLGVGTRIGRKPRGVWMLSGSDVDSIADHRRDSVLCYGGQVLRTLPLAERPDRVAARGQNSRSWLTTAEVASLLGVTERAVRARAAVRGVGSRAHARLSTYSPDDLAELRRPVPRGRRPGPIAEPVASG